MQELLDSVASLSSRERKALAVLLKRQGVNLYGLTPITARLPDELALLSYAQQRQWFLWQLAPDSSAYNIPVALQLSGDLDLAALRCSFDSLISRHEILRSTFCEQGEQAVQVVHPAAPCAWVEESASGLDDAEFIRAYVEPEVQRPFDLQAGPLLRVRLLRRSEREHVLLVTAHHSVSDGWSTPLMVEELVRVYEAASQGRALQLPALPIQYADYALWQRHWMEAGEQGRQLAYWKAQLGEHQPVLELPLDRPRPAQQSHRGARVQIPWPAGLEQRLKGVAQGHGATLFMLLLASFQALLQRYSGQAQIRVGVPTANRNRRETEGLIGFFVNTQVLKAEFDLALTFSGLLQQVKQTVLGAQAHQDLPFEQLVEVLQPQRSQSHSPLFQVMYNHQQHAAASVQRLPGLAVQTLAWVSRTAQFDLTLDTYERGTEFGASLTYATDLFDASSAERLAAHWLNLLHGIAAQPEQRIADLPMLSSREREQVLHGWNPGAQAYPRERTLDQLITAQAERTPSAQALISAAEVLDYAELEARANRLAWLLREHGVGPDVLVGIALGRGVQLVVTLLAVLKAGGAYVPLDPDYPSERLAHMFEDSGLGLLLTSSELAAGLPIPAGVRSLCLEQLGQALQAYPSDPLPALAGPHHLAYVIYTSGSTGRPKGVAIRHDGVVNFLWAMAERPGLAAGDKVLSLASLSFDITVLELYLPLLLGATVVLIEADENKDPQRLLALIQQHDINLVQATPSTWRMLLDQASPAAFAGRKALCGGEALTAELAQRILDQGAQLWNVYGPTETTVWAALEPITRADQVWLGRPIANMAMYLLDANFEPVPQGVVGELHIGGDGLARGYHQRPGLSAERFVANPFGAPGARLYRTGDLARYRAGGVIEYMGRSDHQVKIRGFRIELGEIDARLLTHAAVHQAAVIDIDGPGGKQLVGYLVPRDSSLVQAPQAAQDTLRQALKAHLKATLPDYMVPSHLMLLARMPLTPNNKLDRKALPQPNASQWQPGYVAPRSEQEQCLAAIWAQVLKLERVGLSDNFFELGGHSLLATQVISRVRQQLAVELPLRSLFEASDLAAFAQAVSEGQQSAAPAFTRVSREQPLVLSYAQQRQWFLWQLQPANSAYHIPAALRLHGELDLHALQAAFDALVARHESLRTRFAEAGESVVQIVHAPTAQPLTVHGLENASSTTLEGAIEQRIGQPFDLRQGPLLRVDVWRLGAAEHVLVVTLHHIIADGWSLPLLVNELVQLYAAQVQGQPAELPPLAFQYADYAHWQRQWMAAGERQRQLDYWQAQLGGEPPLLALPSDRPRPAVRDNRGASLDIRFSAAQADALNVLAQAQGVTLFMLLLASLQTLLQRYAGQPEVRVGVPIANRQRAETEGLIGFFVNTQVFKADFTQVQTFSQLLQQVRHTALEAQAHQDLPFEQLVEALAPARSLSHSPLFQVLYNHQRGAATALQTLPGLRVESLTRPASTAQFDLSLNTHESPAGLGATLIYATDLFDAPSIERLAGHWRNLLHSVVANPEQRLAELPLLASAEREQIVQGWNATAADFPNLCLHQLIEQQARLTPQRTALLFGEHSLTYQALNAQANRLAHKLREQGVGPESLVGVALNRSIELVVGLLAVLKAGAAYVPLDPDYPRERLAYLFADSGVQWLLTEQALLAELPIPATVQTLCLDQPEGWLADYSEADLACLNSPLNLAYMIYTSGSTGRPKGAGNSHQALVNRLHWMQKAYALDGSDTVLQKTPFSFDVSVWEFFWPLLSGARLAIAQPGEHRDPQRLVESIQRYAVTTLHFVPSMLQAFVGHADSATCQGLRRIVCSGEALSAELAQQAQAQWPATALYNLYGPTEAAIDVTHWTCQAQERISVPIGRPIDNLKTHVLDAELQVAAPGCNGELYLGGIGLARGYHRRAALTAERFVPDPFATHGGRLYRSGDLARYRGEGVLEYAGRLDHQVKIRGLRIELGEIEAGLLEHADVREAVVLDIDGPAGKQLVGYWVGGADSASLKAHLQQRLPDYMVPSHLLNLASLPVTANGKLDRKALPLPDARDAQADYVAPSSEVEQQLAAIWADVLKLERVGLHDNFFELGGHSLLVLSVIARVQLALGLKVTPQSLFQHPVLADFCASLPRADSAGLDDKLRRLDLFAEELETLDE